MRRPPMLGLLIVAAVGCPKTPDLPRSPVELSLRMFMRPSCGAVTALDYDTSCLAAVYVAALDDTQVAIASECTAFDSNAPAELGELLRGEPVAALAGMSTNRFASFEIRGIHAVASDGGTAFSTPCDAVDNDDHWLFWGRSRPVDLSDYEDPDAGTPVIPIVVDCRDCAFTCGEEQCLGCGGLGLPGCPAQFPESYCVPAVDLRCDKPCSDDDDCFDGALLCKEDTGRCDNSAATGKMCAPCGLVDGGSLPCDEGLSCVARAQETSGFCAAPCPQTFCPTAMKCTRRGNQIQVLDLP